MLEIQCPSCNTQSSMSLVQQVYEGPYRCWKCRNLFRIRIEDEEIMSCVPMSEEEFEKEQQTES